MAEGQSQEVDALTELESDYEQFQERLATNKARLAHTRAVFETEWKVGDPKGQVLKPILERLWDTLEKEQLWLDYLLDEIRRLRVRSFKSEKLLIQAADTTSKALDRINEWMKKYEPLLEQEFQNRERLR